MRPPEENRPPLFIVIPSMDLSLVVPVFNEEENIAPLVAEIHRSLGSGLDFEVIYVDDGSTDGTLERLRCLASHYPALRVVHHARRSGQTAALWSGARAARAPWIVTLDGDGQNDPQDIPRLLAALEDPDSPPRLDMVTGLRRRRRDRWVRRFSSRVANRVRRSVLRDGISDTGCGLKLIRRDAFLALPCFDHAHRFLPALILRGGGRVIVKEVSHRPRARGTSKYGIHNRLWAGIIDLLGVAWLMRRRCLPEATEIGAIEEGGGSEEASTKERSWTSASPG